MSALEVNKSPLGKVMKVVFVVGGLWLLWENIKAGDSAWLFAFFDWVWSWVLRIYEWIVSR
jgi:hypothetical protein